ncbi:hypothetical protein PF008_g27000 [Phytophthora fragariae]|uniref:Uncharacterized protein n=1 Tax=Phytophthora fragariae TaxID=53985 RepID=A0A6G0QFL7_9STRA|nr:hypothetical protein PF008_g27000 [Phytophthora fragariae]
MWADLTQSKEDLAQLSSALCHQEKKFQNAKPAIGRIWQCACGAGAMWSKAWQRPLHRAAYASSTPSPEPVAPAEPVPIERATGRDERRPECVICLDELELGFTPFTAVRPQLPFQLAAGELG